MQDRHFKDSAKPIYMDDNSLTVFEKPRCMAFANVHSYGASDNIPVEVAEDWVNQMYDSEMSDNLIPNLTEPLPIFAGMLLQTLLRNSSR